MSLLAFTYKTEYQFEQIVTRQHFTIKCLPCTDEKQIVKKLQVTISPDVKSSSGTDGFLNQTVYGSYDQPHQSFSFSIEGLVETGCGEYTTADASEKIGMFRYESRYTKPGKSIRAFYRELSNANIFLESRVDTVLFFMQALFVNMHYRSGITGIHTTAEEAFKLGRGVCQDYAHILIALCRLHHIPARYAVGMLIGEGASHAWIEVEDQGKWYGFDPTHNKRVDDQYIKISHGRDYDDCIVDQGILIGGGRQHQNIYVRVTREG